MSTSMVATASVIHARSSSKLAGRDVTKTLSLKSLPKWKSPGVLNQAIVVAKLSFHHAQSKQPPSRTGGIYKQLCTSGMPSGGLSENLRTGRNF
jgi:hypothetical protein